MRQHQSSSAVALFSAAVVLLCPATILAGKIVFPEANDLPVLADDGAAAAPEEQPPAAPPSPCVWAILACCSPGRPGVRPRCFELLGCGGDFWDDGPCSAQLVAAAVRAAARFFRPPR
ncbi:uncharacterized protein LOC134533232 [Bacillus rossius redtenbacheri]|uniref:uncharacterized protein LOC134533232 n=1 Tax=Bacillus rossius redtenbacheri TaxID=93214 RepID=UPI002FDEDF33